MDQTTKAKVLRRIVSPLIICSAFVLCAALGMLIYPEAFHKFFSPSQLTHIPPPKLPHRSYYWDVEHYANMALHNVCNAFYPLWPLTIRAFYHPQTLDQAAYSLLITGTILSFASIFFLLFVFEQALETKYLAFLLVLAYTLNPMAIFRFIGYTESLFSAFCIVFIWCFVYKSRLQEANRIIILAITVFLMSLTRSILIQTSFAAIASLATIVCFEIFKEGSGSRLMTHLQKCAYEIKTTIVLCVSSVLGYAVYGLFCFNSRGDFFAPFHDQQNWGKKLGLHLELLFIPKSLFFDFLGLYLPVIILLLSLCFVYFKIKDEEPYIFIPESTVWNILILYPPLAIGVYTFKSLLSKTTFKQLKTSEYTETLSRNYLFWFCIFFCTAQSIIVFLTQDRLVSLARYVFAIPFFFLALGYFYRCISSEKKYKTILWFIFISAIALIQQWVNYGKDEWLG